MALTPPSSSTTTLTPDESQLPSPAIHESAKFVVLSDWDGTITTFDSNDLTDNYGFGHQKRRDLNIEVLNGKSTFRDAFREMLESIPLSLEECKEILKRDVKLDPGFSEFHAWCKTHSIPMVIVSSGMAPLIRAVLSELIGDEEASRMEIISNDAKVKENGQFEIVYRHPESGFGHDKSQAILPYRSLDPAPILFFFGDGVSDLSAAQHADVLFVKMKENGESDLAQYCDRRGIRYIRFQNFSQVLPIAERIVAGTSSIEQALKIRDASQG